MVNRILFALPISNFLCNLIIHQKFKVKTVISLEKCYAARQTRVGHKKSDSIKESKKNSYTYILIRIFL